MDVSDGVVTNVLSRGWLTPAQVDAARALEARLREQGRSPGLLAVLARGLQPAQVDALRRELAERRAAAADEVAASADAERTLELELAAPTPAEGAAPAAKTAWLMPAAVLPAGETPPTAKLARMDEAPAPGAPVGKTAWMMPAAQLSLSSSSASAPVVETAPTAKLPRMPGPGETQAAAAEDRRPTSALSPPVSPFAATAALPPPAPPVLPAPESPPPTATPGVGAGTAWFTPAAYVPGSTVAAPPPGEYVPGTTVAAPPPGAPGSTVAAAWAPGLVIGDLTIGRKLGQGGMGAVFLAERAGGGQVAVKVLSLDADRSAIERFRREGVAQATADSHPAVARVWGAGEAHGHLYLVMELLQGGDLQQRLDARGPVPPEEAARLVAALARGVAHVHARGVLHRDLKPANVMFDGQGAPKLVDFGIARIRGEGKLTTTGQIVGSPAYASPEQAAGEVSRIEERTDVYGLGAILYSTLTARLAFDGTTLPEVLTKVMFQPPAPPSTLVKAVPPALDRIVLQALAKEPERRYASARAMADDLERFLAGAEVQAVAPRVRRRTPWAVIPLATFGVLALVALATRSWGTTAVDLGPPRATISVAPLVSADGAIPVVGTVDGEVARLRLRLDGREQRARFTAPGAIAGCQVEARDAGRHVVDVVIADTGEVVASAAFERIKGRPVIELDAEHIHSAERAVTLRGRIRGTFNRLALETADGCRRPGTPAGARSRRDLDRAVVGEDGSFALPLTIPEHGRLIATVVAADDRSFEPGEVALEVQLSHLPPAPPGLRLDVARGLYVNERDGSLLRWIPAGEGVLGARSDDPYLMVQRVGNPLRAVTIAEGFFLGVHEVTWAQVRRWCEQAGRAPPPQSATRLSRSEGRGARFTPVAAGADGEHPASSLSWDLAAEYCAAAGLRLPTEVEWEYSARGPAGLHYPWGDDIDVQDPSTCRANHAFLHGEAGEAGTLAVGSFPAARFSGCFDLAGNVWEYVLDAAETPRSPEDPERRLHVIRGGAYDSEPLRTQAPYRQSDDAHDGSHNVGFRVARGAAQVVPSANLPPEPAEWPQR